MKTILVGALALTVTVLAGCGDDKKDSTTTTAARATGPANQGGDSGDREAALKKAAQGYVDALLKDQFAGATGYLDPKVCDDGDQGSLALAAGQIHDVAEGATMTITAVKMDGDRGGVQDYTLSDNAPDQLRRLVKASMTESKQYAWSYRDGEWYLVGPCEDESPSPEPSA